LSLVNGIYAICSLRTGKYYNEARTHLSLGKDAPHRRAVQAHGHVLPFRFWAAYTTNIAEPEFSTGTGGASTIPSATQIGIVKKKSATSIINRTCGSTPLVAVLPPRACR
jgi:hypothetical protein